MEDAVIHLNSKHKILTNLVQLLSCDIMLLDEFLFLSLWVFENIQVLFYHFSFFFSIIFYFLSLLKIQQTTKHKNFVYIRKIKRKINPQPKTEPLPKLHLAVPRQHTKSNRTYFRSSFWSNCSIFETRKGEWLF